MMIHTMMKTYSQLVEFPFLLEDVIVSSDLSSLSFIHVV